MLIQSRKSREAADKIGRLRLGMWQERSKQRIQAFARGIHRIYAECDPENTASWRLLERLGFQREAHFKQNVYFWRNEKGGPIWKDTYVYARLAAQEK